MIYQVSVIHLVYIPYGINLFQNFIDSYLHYSAGLDHNLILVFNGAFDEVEVRDYHEYIRNRQINYYSYYYPQGQDLEVYSWIAKQISSEYLFFVNSFSRFLTNNWLRKFVNIDLTKIGVISATGSWQSHYSNVFEKFNWTWANNLSFKENITKYKLLLKASFLWRFYFKPFPNPHIRTNSFLISRSLFISLKFKTPKTKFDAYRIESGRNSITQQILNKGLDVLIIDKFGITFSKKEWNKTHTFWSGNQENLIISDNQTRLYDLASPEEKFDFSYSAWRNLP